MVQLNQQGDKKNQNELFLTGTSFDEKPIKINGSYPPQFSMFYEIDTGVLYIFDYENKEWVPSNGASYIPEGAATIFVVKVIQDETTGEWKIYNNGGTITTIQYDNEPIANSKNLVNSGNLYTYIQNHSGGGGSTEGVGRKNPNVTGAEEFNQYGADYRAQGTYSHAEGNGAIADGDNSHAGGMFTHATNQSQVAIGEFNDPKTDTTKDHRLGTIVEIGNGTVSARSNIVEVYYDKININGDIYKNGQPLFDGLSFVKCTQAEYDAIVTPDPNTVYIIVG